ncbi:MAG TPA: c-type cytochrome [Candidatus Aquilonibacter sp.]|nr:c-type cytochrome [Candidatus Aquilonibacter sp.]
MPTKILIAAVAMLLAPLSMGQRAKSRPASAALVARGKYLVDGIGLCDDCHTPRDEKGEFIADRRLQGAMVPFKPIMAMPVWADRTPAIAGLPGWEKDAAIKFLMTGIAYNGLPPRPPMPAYRFNRPDAEAVAAYLMSLAPEKK